MRDAAIDPRWRGRRVAVAMSGGVDSSVAAVLLARAGCEVVGLTMKLWDYRAVGGDLARDGRCCTVESMADCRTVADRHGFPHYTLDMTDAFAATVIGDFVREYEQGRTPNPCAVCNKEIKWSALWEKAQAIGCEALATGHYARLESDPQSGIVLRRGVDPARDQSYFLWCVPRSRLAQTIFPLGSLLKSTVRELARELGLVNAERPESRDICFVTDGDVTRFLAAHDCVSTAGEIRDRDGRTVGRHEGYAPFTVGQRHGLGVAAGRRLYITRIDAATGTVWLGEDADLYRHACRVSNMNWLIDPPTHPLAALAQIRYRHEAAPAQITPISGDQVELVFETPQRAITPGQSAVFYAHQADQLLGGGLIASVAV